MDTDKEIFLQNNVSLLENTWRPWPARSPDMNPRDVYDWSRTKQSVQKKTIEKKVKPLVKGKKYHY